MSKILLEAVRHNLITVSAIVLSGLFYLLYIKGHTGGDAVFAYVCAYVCTLMCMPVCMSMCTCPSVVLCDSLKHCEDCCNGVPVAY